MNPTPTPVTDLPLLPERPAETHKGAVGRVGIVAGSRGLSGAAVLCGLGALRGGAGLVRVYCPASIQPIVATSEPCLMTVALDESSPEAFIEPLLDDDWSDVLAVGPGLGPSDQAEWLTRTAVTAGTARPIVLDADGLNPLARHGPRTFVAHDPGAAGNRVVRPAVITPHPGEMARLRGGAGLPAARGDDDPARVRIAHEYAVLSASVVVLKGYRTVVCACDRVYVNATGNPGMATGGMGDVLTGLIAALIGQGLAAFEAAVLGVHLHGLAADLCAEQLGPVGYLARDVAERLPAALRQVRRGRIGFHQR